MKRGGILHPELSAHLARLGHTDTFVIGDAGLPVPPGVARVDLAVSLGVPGFAEVLDAVLAEIEVEGVIIAAEASGSSAGALLEARLPGAETVPHEEFKQSRRDRPARGSEHHGHPWCRLPNRLPLLGLLGRHGPDRDHRPGQAQRQSDL